MAQVVDSTNIDQFLTTGKVDAFKPPETKSEEKVEVKTTEAETKADAPKGDDDEVNLPEHARKVIGKKHRAMKEAEEFAEREYNERRAAEKRADQESAKRAELEAKLAEYEKSRSASVEATEPKQEDFKTVQEYIAAKVDFEVKQSLQKKQAEDEKSRIQNEAQRIRDDFGRRIAETMKSVPDYAEVTEASDIEVPSHVSQHILESPVGPLLGYWLAKPENRKETDRILKLSPIRAIAELGKIEDRLEKKSDVKETVASVPASKAPAPITPIEGKTTPVNADLNREMSFAEYKALKAQGRK